VRHDGAPLSIYAHAGDSSAWAGPAQKNENATVVPPGTARELAVNQRAEGHDVPEGESERAPKSKNAQVVSRLHASDFPTIIT
jgi:hypothetical protein